MQPQRHREHRDSHRGFICDFSLRSSPRSLRLRGCICSSGRRAGFSLVELLVVIGIVILLLSIFIPYFSSIVETSRRNQCQDNLRKIGFALSAYAQANRGAFPRVRYDAENNPHGYTAFTGADAADPFAADSAVSANDVTASLWLLLRGSYFGPLEDDHAQRGLTSVFVCPSARGYADAMLDAAGQPVSAQRRGNFRSPANLGYSYASPFSDATGYGMIDFYLNAQFVILADRNPGVGRGSDVTAPAHNAAPVQMSLANSRNHNRAGQYALYADMHVEFASTPYCGVGGDNIYTALAPEPIFTGMAPALNANGRFIPNGAPAWQTDSFLVPAD